TERTALSEDVIVGVAPDSPEATSTVGAVARDARGDLAAASSSGGTTNKYAGRVGQAGIPGAGVFAHNATCAVACTGQGEAFMRSSAAHAVSALMEHAGLDLRTAAGQMIGRRLPGKGGLIALDAHGNVALPFNTEGMYRGWLDADGARHTAIYDEVKTWPS